MCMYACAHIYICVYIYMCMYTYLYIYIHMHIFGSDSGDQAHEQPGSRDTVHTENEMQRILGSSWKGGS